MPQLLEGPQHLELHLHLALPPALSLAAVVVVTQTLVELIGMIAYVRIVPRLAPAT